MFCQDDIQGNILKPFKRKHGRFVFFEVRSRDVREPLGQLLLSHVSSAEAHARAAGKGLAMAGLSGSGFARLQLPAAVPEAGGAGTKSFQAGMRNLRYWNPRLEHWEPDYLTRPIDAFVFFADDDPGRLQDTVSGFEAELNGLADSVRQEPVKSLRDAYQNEYEHFGFRDDMTKGIDPARVLLQETWHGANFAFGCFAVILKIEQHADRFETATRGLAAAAGVAGVQVTPEQIAERVIGRRRSGEPLAAVAADPETFSFAGTEGSQCPYHAHVRVMNPRDGRPDPVIIRRGMAYDRGLMFVSLHRSLLDFTSLMFRAERARDPILSSAADWKPDFTPPNGCVTGRKPGQKWEFEGQTVCYSIADLTTMRGGEYFYIPSLPFLRRLAGIQRGAE